MSMYLDSKLPRTEATKPKMRGLRLLASTSVLAIALAATPITIDLGDDVWSWNTASAKSGSCCFVGATEVLMADGTPCAIEDIRVGDEVRSGYGQINRVVGIERPQLGQRQLYSLNRSNPFVTAEHPFLSTTGWKSISPAATVRENENLAVEPLTVGDDLTVLRHVGVGVEDNLAVALQLDIVHIRLECLQAHQEDPELRVYNLLLDGDHTYVADGFVVHNKDGDGDSGGEGSGDSGGDSSGGEGGEGSGDSGGDSSGGDSGGSSGGDSSGGEGGEGSGDSGGDSSGESGESGDDSGESGESGDDSGESGESGDDSGESGESGDDSGESGESGDNSGESGESGDDSGESGESGESGISDVSPSGPDLSPGEEAEAISNGWE